MAEWLQSKAAADVLDERRRQVEKYGRTTENDDTYVRGELALAAGAYLDGDQRIYPWKNVEAIAPHGTRTPEQIRQAYVYSAALLIAEIERLDRLAAASAEKAVAHG